MNYSRENDELRQRIVELEHQSPELDDQMQALLGPNLHSYHGPDTIEHLKIHYEGYSSDSDEWRYEEELENTLLPTSPTVFTCQSEACS